MKCYEEERDKLIELILNKPIPKGNEVIYSRKELLEAGFSKHYISKFVEKGFIARKKPGIYSFIGRKELFEKGPYLVPEQSKKCYQLCIRIASSDIDEISIEASYKAILLIINEKDYPEVWDYIRVLRDTNDSDCISDAAAFVSLLDHIIVLPKDFKSWFKDDIRSVGLARILKTTESNESFSNTIRALISEGTINEAKERLKTIKEGKEKSPSTADVILSKLVVAATEYKRIKEKKILDLVKDKKYEEIVEYLKTIEYHKLLSHQEKTVLKISEIIINIKKGRAIPTPITPKAHSITEALNNDNYLLAAAFAVREENNPKDNDPIYILLRDLYKLKKDNITVSDIIAVLKSCDNIEIVLSYISLYLGTDNSTYISYFRTLIDICERENQEFGRVEKDLPKFKNQDFSLDANGYLRDAARAYNGNQLGLSNLYYSLHTIAVSINQELGTVMGVFEDQENSLGIFAEPQQTPISTSSSQLEEEYSKEPELPEDYARVLHMNLMLRKDIIVLPPMSEARLNDLRIIIKEDYEDISTYVMVEGKEKRLVLKYSPHIATFDYCSAISDLNSKLARGDYSGARQSGLLALHYLDRPQNLSNVLAVLGGTYKGLGEYHLSRQYYSLASALTQRENIKSEYSSTISYICEKDQSNELESNNLVFSEQALINKYNFGLENVQEIILQIVDQIIKTLGNEEKPEQLPEDIKDILRSLIAQKEYAKVWEQLSEDNQDILTLLIAREAYMSGDNKFGNELLQTISNKSISDEVRLVYHQIIEDRPYYKDWGSKDSGFPRIDELSMHYLTLSLKKEEKEGV